MHNDNALNLFRLERWLWNLALSSQSQIRSGWWFRPFSAQLVCLLTRVFKVFHYISLFQTKIKRNLCCNAFRNVCLCLDNPLVEQVLSWFFDFDFISNFRNFPSLSTHQSKKSCVWVAPIRRQFDPDLVITGIPDSTINPPTVGLGIVYSKQSPVPILLILKTSVKIWLIESIISDR